MRWVVILSLCIGLFVLLLLPVSAQEPVLRVTAPRNGTVIESTTVTVTFEVEAFEIVPSTIPVAEAGQHSEVNQPGQGHVHFTLDQQPLITWESADPYVFTGVPAGEHELMVELANNDHTPLAPPVMRTIRFTVNPPPGGMPVTGNAPLAWVAPLLLILGSIFVLIAVIVSPKQHSPL